MKLKIPIYDSLSLSLIYTPGVGEVCKRIEANAEDAYKYTNIGNSMAIITDCSDYKNVTKKNWITDAAIPKLEAQALFFKLTTFIDAFPFIIDAKQCKSEDDIV